MKNIFKILSFLTLTIFIGCLADREIFEPYPNLPSAWSNFAKTQLDVSGEIVDEKGNPLENVSIEVGGKEVKTNKRGFFYLLKTNDTPERILVKASKLGFFKGSRIINGTKNGTNHCKIMLMERKNVAQFKNAKGSKLSIGKASVNFSETVFADAKGTIFTGNVNVAAQYLDPSNPDTYLKMPGNMQAVDFQGEERILGTYGMVVCELTDDAGNEIKIQSNSNAEITFPIRSVFEAKQATTMPLWHFDEVVGTWREDGVSLLEGNSYKGKVKHFSFWNCDAPFPVVDFKATITDKQGNPSPGLSVLVCFTNSKDSIGVATGYAVPDKDGMMFGKVPKDKVMTLKVTELCGKVLYTVQIGPFNTATVLPPIMLDINTTQDVVIKIKGKLLDCNGKPVKKGVVYSNLLLKSGNPAYQNIILTDSLGNFATTMFNSKCYAANDFDKITLVAFDNIAQKESQLKSQTVVANGVTDFGAIDVCDNLSEYIKLNANGKDYTFLKPYAEGSLYISGQDSTLGKFSFFQMNIQLLNAMTAGQYPGIISGTMMLDNQAIVLQTSSQSLPVDLTKYATQIGDYYEGTFNQVSPPIIFTDPQGKQFTFKGSFKIRRQF